MKIDIEGDEWDALADMVKSGMFKNIKQLLVEFHFWKRKKETSARLLYVFRLLFEEGLRKFSRERLNRLQVEMSFINILHM